MRKFIKEPMEVDTTARGASTSALGPLSTRAAGTKLTTSGTKNI